jgi:plasmid stabilization system protein ParE
MPRRIQYALAAKRDVREIIRWYRDQSAEAVEKWMSLLRKAEAGILDQPQAYPISSDSDELGIEIREAQIGKRHGVYRIWFIVSEDCLTILRVRHAARDALTADDLRIE